MRRLTSILLVLLLLFNALGFYGFIIAVKYQHNQALTERFDLNDYNHQKAITLKIPHSIPYPLVQSEFHRADGEFMYKGEFYKLIKHRVSMDAVYMIAVKDEMGKRTHQALTAYSKTLSAEQSADKQTGKVSINYLKDYFGSSFTITTVSFGWELNIDRSAVPEKYFDSRNPHSIFTPPENV